MSDSSSQELTPEATEEVATRGIYMADGLWFLAVEEMFGFETAFAMNQRVWKKGGPIHVRRLRKNLDLKGMSPIEALAATILADPIMAIRQTKITEQADTRVVFKTCACPPAAARLRDGRGVFNGVPGCGLFFQAFATLTDPRIKARCISRTPCTTTPENPGCWCEWEFTFSEEKNLTPSP